MTKLSYHILFVVLSLVFLTMNISAPAQEKYQVNIKAVDRDSSFLKNELGLQRSFASQIDAEQYINQLPTLLHSKGFVTASIDSVQIDSTSAHLILFLGKAYQWALIDASHVDTAVLNGTGWR